MLMNILFTNILKVVMPLKGGGHTTKEDTRSPAALESCVEVVTHTDQQPGLGWGHPDESLGYYFGACFSHTY